MTVVNAFKSAIAHLLTDRFDRMLGIAVIASVVSCIVGAYASYYFDASTGGAMVLTLGLFFIVTFMFAPKYGVLKRSWPQKSI